MRKPENVRYENQFYRPRRVGSNRSIYILFGVTVALVVSTVVLGIFALKGSKKDLSNDSSSSASSETQLTDEQGGLITFDPTDVSETESTPAGPNELQNPNLYPATVLMNVPIGKPVDTYAPSARGVNQTIFNQSGEIGSFARNPEIHFGDPLNYQQFAGILTFRGNNFRNCASWGYANIDPTKPEGEHFEKVWEFTEMQWKSTPLSSSWSWVGAGWTGQPLAVRWGYDMQQTMNLYPDKKSKENLTEIILASQDGHVYFLDLDDGQKTRDPINVGATIKGTPAVDPRGYPLLYVGQGDDNGTRGEVGYRIYSLLNGELLHFEPGLDSRAYRSNWGACDSSPIIDGNADTLIYPSENGMIYTMKLNTDYRPDLGKITVSPETTVYRYSVEGQSGGQFGIESSMSIYDHYGWCSDNGGNLLCIDLNSMQMVWSRRLDDDSDVTPVIEEENGHVYLYTGTEVDWQNEAGGDYQGQAFTYKIDAMTGETVWQKSQGCYTHNGDVSSDDINGGMLGTPIMGKKSISNLVIFSYCMTKNVSYGNALVAYDKTTGNEVWRYDWNTYTWSSPVDVYDKDGNAYIVVFDSQGQGHLVDGSTGKRIGLIQGLKQDTLGNFEASPIVVDDMVVIAQRSPAIYGVKIS